MSFCQHSPMKSVFLDVYWQFLVSYRELVTCLFMLLHTTFYSTEEILTLVMPTVSLILFAFIHSGESPRNRQYGSSKNSGLGSPLMMLIFSD